MALGKITLAFITLLLGVLLPTSILLYNIENTMLKPQFWENELDRLNAYDTLKTALAGQLGGNTQALPDAWLKEQSHTLLDNLLAYIRGEKQALDLTINTKGVAEGMREALYRQVEKDVDRQIEELNYKPEYREQARAQLLKDAKKAIDEQLNAFPESANLAEGMDTSMIDQARAYTANALAVTKALQVTSLLLLVFGLALAGNRHDMAKWLGKTLALTGASLLALELIVPYTLEKTLAQTGAPELAKQLAADLFADIMAKTTPQGAVLAVAGIALFLYGRAGETTPEEKPPAN